MSQGELLDSLVDLLPPEPCSKKQVIERMNKQLKENVRIEKSDFVIFNNPEDQILNQVHQVHSEILSN